MKNQLEYQLLQKQLSRKIDEKKISKVTDKLLTLELKELLTLCVEFYSERQYMRIVEFDKLTTDKLVSIIENVDKQTSMFQTKQSLDVNKYNSVDDLEFKEFFHEWYYNKYMFKKGV